MRIDRAIAHHRSTGENNRLRTRGRSRHADRRTPAPKSYEKLPLTDYPRRQPRRWWFHRHPHVQVIGPQIDEDPAPRQSNFQSNVRVIRTVLGDAPTRPACTSRCRCDADGAVRFDRIRSRNSRQYRNEMDSLYIAALDVTLERHLFSPRPFVKDRYAMGRAVGSRLSIGIDRRCQAGVRQRLPYGGEIVASGLVEFVNGLNASTSDGENAELAIHGTIPLLRNAGMINLEGLIQSERDLVYAVRNFETFRRNFSIQIASAYFRLLTQQSSIRNRYVRYIESGRSDRATPKRSQSRSDQRARSPASRSGTADCRRRPERCNPDLRKRPG